MTPTAEFLQQYAALSEGVGLAELPERTFLVATGSDRASFLHSFTTHDIRRLVPGSGCEAFVTSHQGKTIGHVLVFCEADQIVLDTSPGQAASLKAHFERFILTEDVAFADQTGQWVDLLVAGPQAAALLGDLCGMPPPAEMLGHRQVVLEGRPVILRHVPYAGPDSFFLVTTPTDVQAVRGLLEGVGATPCEMPAVEARRIEAGFPLYGQDISADNLPQEVNRNAVAISFTKGCYLGQETVARIDALGHVNRVLTGLRFPRQAQVRVGERIMADGAEAATITSVTYSPRQSAVLALAYVRSRFARPTTVLSTPHGPAEVVTLPL
jgi:folate-binding protein YgfZ